MDGLLRNAGVGTQQFGDSLAHAQFLQNYMNRNTCAFDDRLSEQNFRVGDDELLPLYLSHGFECVCYKYRSFLEQWYYPYPASNTIASCPK